MMLSKGACSSALFHFAVVEPVRYGIHGLFDCDVAIDVIAMMIGQSFVAFTPQLELQFVQDVA